jgi:ABC-2 type transport system ATP-binding protein
MCTADEPVLEVSGLVKRFGSRLAVAGLSLRVMPGELLALVGPNGSGKSTVLRMLGGLLKPDNGHGRICGCDLKSFDRNTRNSIGYLPQRAALYASLSIAENLRFRAAVAGMPRPAVAAWAALQELGLAGRARETLVQLSGGWTRRVEIAATLIHRPQLLLLDEPTTGLDTAARDSIWVQLQSCLERGSAIIYSSHEGAELARATRCVKLPEALNAC